MQIICYYSYDSTRRILRQFSKESSNEIFKILAQRARIEKKCSFHISRHSFAVRALHRGISLDKVSKLMAHASIRETQVYAQIVNKELHNAMDAFN